MDPPLSEMIEFNKEKDKRVYIAEHTLKQMMETIENNNNILNREDMKETLLNDEQEDERVIANIKKEEDFSCDGEEVADDEPEPDHPAGHGGMSPVETATLLLLSRIALFNKVGNCMQISYQRPREIGRNIRTR